jgi:hypothetical protein
MGTRLSFDGTGNYVNVPDSNLLDLTNGMTISAWVNPSALGSRVCRNVIIKERSGGEVYNLYANANTNTPSVYIVRGSAPGTSIGLNGTNQIPVNSWTYLAATLQWNDAEVVCKRSTGSESSDEWKPLNVYWSAENRWE